MLLGTRAERRSLAVRATTPAEAKAARDGADTVAEWEHFVHVAFYRCVARRTIVRERGGEIEAGMVYATDFTLEREWAEISSVAYKIGQVTETEKGRRQS